MSDAELFNEFESNEPSAVYRYYDYVNDAEGNASTVIVAISELIDHLPARITLPVEKMFDPQDYELLYEMDTRRIHEDLSLLPLMYMGPLLEQSDCSTEELADWYSHVTRMVIATTKRSHDVGCLSFDEANPVHLMCQDSLTCPQRFLSRFLCDDVWLPDFTRKKYLQNPARAKAIAVNKLELGAKYGLTLPVLHDALLDRYNSEYDAYIDELVKAVGWDDQTFFG